MSQNANDAGVVQALLDRFNTQRFPRAMELKAKVDRGDKLENFEIDYLAEVLADIRSIKALVNRHPEYEALVVKGMNLYTEITEKALGNESK
ncbi:MAG: hypothetical protein QG616_2302 [Pseudomonadota bacterium]|jgi:hypothetical protein|nr:hypothetical protein [Pseudomonadota bacterium]MDQ5882470.1 hypothetical protein [Pseudomonadota bacterium]MDQ5904903.1 hypothetical protein [Pseudomonadota bacterium]MDQ5919005.1 hypothetical protein [Pseudomonadota bacterium]MDQ5941541.1 hypothetical protein [Pseudomonadota bacterium]